LLFGIVSSKKANCLERYFDERESFFLRFKFNFNVTPYRHYAYTRPVTKDEFKGLRSKAGYTQATLAREIGVHLRTVTRWEIGEVIIPRVVELAICCVAEARKEKRRA
jgi:DNA-binding XRE family transcriptional regulator